MMGERSGRWLRVSTKKQDETTQVPDVTDWEQAHGYDVTAEYVIRGYSAYKGNKNFDAAWEQVLADFRSGKITVLVVWKTDRIDRKLQTFKMLEEVADLGGRVEFVTQPHLNQLTTMVDRIALYVQQEIAHEESKVKADRIRAKQQSVYANNGLWGKPPFGYSVVRRTDGYKTLEPNDVGRRFIPQIFERIANGDSLRDVARWLDSAGVKPVSEADRNGKPVTQWSPQSVRGIIRNRTYAGQRKAHETIKKVTEDEKGKQVETVTVRRGKGTTRMEGIEPLVTAKLWETANARLDSTPRGKRGTVKHPPALLTSAVECGNCGGRVYRIFSGHGKWRTPYYRCAGQPPQQKGCGMVIRLTLLDSIVNEAIMDNDRPAMEHRLIPGTASAIEERIAEIGYELRDLPSRGLDEDAEDAERARLRTERRSLESDLANAEPSRWELCLIIGPDGEPVTYAGRWEASDFDGKRTMLKEFRITVKWQEVDGQREPLVGIAPKAWE